ncbi:circularly permuted type 2 ATP-grasp protein [Methylotenera sp.]|uniref:circularly permuted type 2 ATP-grasp protein n=1 Tax=Methylotenera sp. TaxID=2051956 RepID=UPI002730D499|nr:circularly permuted type 2 ATP-grasp protein [Methylotenera sp.]MDP2071604.1 circularly permuted type 2 ATP-grasp protein [Methylotenera sp.]MDP3006694.1 circularly permuted type 2 ATP-grasp protein [Methylotenera sp.]
MSTLSQYSNTAEDSAWLKGVAGYTPEANIVDEMLDSTGKVRPHWEYFIQALQKLGHDEIRLRQNEILKLLRENGVTYNVYGDPDGSNRPWQLDPVPLLIENDEWTNIETGLLERAELLNLILADIYGPRELIQKGLLPVDLLFSHSGFLRACDKVKIPGKHQLVLYAADLARGPDNRMWVIGDRTQAPSGAGYALENRLAMSRVFPNIFRDSRVQRLDGFFQSLRNALQQIAPQNADTPRVVVLTPGPFNETFFEHAYLASHLGYPLVQGDDLTVRDGFVWLKSLNGLQRVDVIMRRVDDSFCDPLELREDSRLGVPGLLEVARRGNVTIANPLGSGVLESPGLLPFLPKIAEHFFGKQLRLPSAATWWCGQAKELNYVLSNLHKLVIKHICRGSMTSVFGHLLSQQQIIGLRDRIRSNPALFVGQAHESFSTAPSFVAGHLEPRQALLRCFLVAQGQGYSLMPGSLTRSAAQQGNVPVSNQMGAISKDTWVIGGQNPNQANTIETPHSKLLASNYTSTLSSRVAENLFWVGRYAERTEGSIRLLRTTVKKLYINPDINNPYYKNSLYAVLRGLTNITNTYPGFLNKESDSLLKTPDSELLSLMLDEEKVGSIANNQRSLIQAGYSVRNLWSSDTWRVMDEIKCHLERSQQLTESTLWNIQEHMDRLITALSAFSGLIMESMTRGNGWLFLDMGRRLERALLLISLLRSGFSSAQAEGTEILLMESLLDTSDNLICYRQHYRNSIELPSFIELLILDKNNPRSLAYQFNRIQEHVSKMPRKQTNTQLSIEERLILEANSLLDLTNLSDLIKVSDGNVREKFDQTLSRLYYLLATLSDTVTATYFQHGQPQHSLVAVKPA